MQTVLAVAAAVFKYKAVTSVIALVCWPSEDQNWLVSLLWSHGIMAAAICSDNPAHTLNISHPNQMLGVLYFAGGADDTLYKLQRFHFTTKYKWLIVGEEVPAALHSARYDADIALVRRAGRAVLSSSGNTTDHARIRGIRVANRDPFGHPLELCDVLIRPDYGGGALDCGLWRGAESLRVVRDNARMCRRYDFQGHVFKIAAPMGIFNQSGFRGGFRDYLLDERTPEVESTTRCGYAFTTTLLHSLNIKSELIPTVLWVSYAPGSSSMARMVSEGEAHISGSVLRILNERLDRFEFISTVWPFRLAFTYVAARESDSNMFAAPFSRGVWCACAGSAVLLALALLLVSRGRHERDGAVYSVVAVCLQQDASAVPEGARGRGVFLVLSVCSMLLHSYYTSAVVSSLLRGGRAGPSSIRELADSNLKAAAEDYDYVHDLLFDVQTTWDDLEYFKKKKKTSSFYQTLQRGVEMISAGDTAFHSELNGIYSSLARELPDSALCRLRHIDTVPEVSSYVVASKHSEYAGTLKAKSLWLHETGVARRLLSRWRASAPACRAAVLVERVKMADVAPLAAAMAAGAGAALLLLLVEIACAGVTCSANMVACGAARRVLRAR